MNSNYKGVNVMNKSQLIEYLKDRAKISLTAELDDLPVRGNSMASGDDDLEKEIEDRIIARINNDDVWAWASVKVTAKFNDFEGTDYLGACSYRDEDDFKSDLYYTDMISTAIEELADNILTCNSLLKAIKTEI